MTERRSVERKIELSEGPHAATIVLSDRGGYAAILAAAGVPVRFVLSDSRSVSALAMLLGRIRHELVQHENALALTDMMGQHANSGEQHAEPPQG